MQIPIAKLLSVLAILGIFGVVAGITAVTAQDDSDGHIPKEIRNVIPPTPEPRFTQEEMRAKLDAAREAYKTEVPVIQGTPIEMPSDAIFKGLVIRGQQFPIIINGETIEPMQLPFYRIIRDGELATVSKDTGRFMIGENQKETFQFLIDQLGESKMQVLDNDYYEEHWGPYREDAREEGGR